MKEQNRLRLLFVLLFTTVIIALGLVAIIIAMSMSLSQLRQENKLQNDKIWILQNKIDSLTPTYTEKQQKILEIVVGNPDIGKLIKTKPVLGGSWGVWSEKSVKFITEDRLLIIYDDGHLMGAMVVRAVNPVNIISWRVLWSTVF
ncbi:MAG: hypothetical protein KGZ86_00355 [Candidatus Latescibacteria bacterium]|nr:hypothetical protein [Candidatus Latescibacterota bacterium]